MADIHSLAVLKVHLAAGSARQMNGGYRRGSRSGQWLVPGAHNSEVDHQQALYLEVPSKDPRQVRVVVFVAADAARQLVEP